MKVTFIEHSGFMVEMEQNVLLFDYYQGEIPSFDGSKTLYVFASHSHADHYDPAIWKLKEQYKDTFFSDRVLEYIRINGECKFQHYKTEKFDYDIKEEKVKIFAIMKKDNSIKNIIDKTLINVPVILESKNNQWYDVKYKLVRRR